MLDFYCRPKICFVTVGLIIDLVPAVNSLIGLPPAFIVHSFAARKNHKSWFDLLQGFTDNRPHLATRIQTPSARDGHLDKCGNVIPF